MGTGSYSSAVTWSVNSTPGGNSTLGTISSSGLYTAPAAIPTGYTNVTIGASSESNATITSQATISFSYPLAMLSTGSLAFPATAVGQTSPAQSVTLTNTGSAALSINSIAIGGANSADFSESNNCNVSLSPQASCNLSVQFIPSAAGTNTATINIADNASSSPQTITLSGTSPAAPAVSFNPTSLTFPATGVGSISSAQSLTLTNTGSATLNITSIVPDGAFTQNSGCGTTLAVGASCTIAVTFSPPCTGTDTFVPGNPTAYSGSITITDNAAGASQSVELMGSGLSSATATLAPGAILWGADGHRDKGGPYTAVGICQQIADLHQVFGSTPNAIFYRAWDSVHDYNFNASADILQFQAAGIIPLMGAVVDPPSLPGGSILANPASTYADGYTWAYDLAKSDAQAAPTNVYWFVGNEWDNLVCGSSPYPTDPTDPLAWRQEPLYQAYLGALAGAMQAIRDVIPSAQIISGANGGTTSIGLTIAFAQDLKAKNLKWDYTNLHWYNDYASTQSYQAHYESPGDFHGAGSFASQTYDAYTMLFPAGSGLFVDEFGSSNGAISTISTENDAGAGAASVELMSELLARAMNTASERGIVAATFYQLYPLLDGTGKSGLDKYLFTVSGSTTALSGQGSAVKGAIGQNPGVNSGANFSLSASPVTIASPGSSASSTITLIPGSGMSAATSVSLKCIVWSESQTDPSLNPSCSFGGQPVASVGMTATTATVTITTQAGTAARAYVLTIIGTTPGSSTDTNVNCTVN